MTAPRPLRSESAAAAALAAGSASLSEAAALRARFAAIRPAPVRRPAPLLVRLARRLFA